MFPSLGEGNATARFYQRNRWLGGRVAARGARAAAGDAGDRVSRRRDRPTGSADRLRAFRKGLKESGYVEGENVAIEYRWAERPTRSTAGAGGRIGSPSGRRDRRDRQLSRRRSLPRRQPRRSPSCFLVGEDPVRLGLVASLARPGGNLTGINFFTAELAAKRLELLREMVPGAARIAVLVNPANATTTRDHVERHGSGCPRHGAANPGPQRQHQPRDRCGLRGSCARAARRRSSSASTRFFNQPACSIGPPSERSTRCPQHIRRVNWPKPAG